LKHKADILPKWGVKPVWNAQPVRAINLPDAFWDFARRLPSDYEVVKLLKLLPEYGISACLEGIEAAASVGAYAYEAVRSKLEQRQHPSLPAQLLTNPIQIKQVDLSTYDAMLEGGEVL